MPKGENINWWDVNEKRERSFCSDCFDYLIINKKIRYNNDAQGINYPLFTDCCESLYLGRNYCDYEYEQMSRSGFVDMDLWKWVESQEEETDLILLSKIENFPYFHYWNVCFPYVNKEKKHYNFHRKNGDKRHLTLCEKCVKNQQNIILIEESLDIPVTFLRRIRDYKSIISSGKKISIEDFDRNFGYSIGYSRHIAEVKHLRKMLQIRDELKVYMKKRVIYRISYIYMVCLARNFKIQKDIIKLISRMV